MLLLIHAAILLSTMIAPSLSIFSMRRTPQWRQLSNTLGPYIVDRQLKFSGDAAVYLAHTPTVSLHQNVAIKCSYAYYYEGMVSYGNEVDKLDLLATSPIASKYVLPIVERDMVLNAGQLNSPRRFICFSVPLAISLPPPRQLRVQAANELVDAVAAMHASGVAHNDLMFDNIMMWKGHIVLIDFALGIRLGQNERRDEMATSGDAKSMTAVIHQFCGGACGTAEEISMRYQTALDRYGGILGVNGVPRLRATENAARRECVPETVHNVVIESDDDDETRRRRRFWRRPIRLPQCFRRKLA